MLESAGMDWKLLEKAQKYMEYSGKGIFRLLQDLIDLYRLEGAGKTEIG